jgi:hypothetical protein
MLAASGRLSDISSENWPLVSPSGRNAASKAPRHRPRRLLKVQAQAGVANPERNVERELVIGC